jgi:DNA-binding HxlR family transcriptional regulator
MPEPSCQIVRTLDVIGEKWSLLIVRNALRGQTKFSEFRESLGAPTDILTARLAKLVAAGVLEKRSYREEGSRERTSYHLTSKGEALRIVVASMIEWGDEHNPAPAGIASRVVDGRDGHPLRLGFVDDTGRVTEPRDIVIVPGPISNW